MYSNDGQSFHTANPRFAELAAAQNFSAILLPIQLAATERLSKFENSSENIRSFEMNFENFRLLHL